MEISSSKILQNNVTSSTDGDGNEMNVAAWDELTLTVVGTSTSFNTNVYGALDENKDYVKLAGYKEDDSASGEIVTIAAAGGYSYDISSYKYIKAPTIVNDTGNIRIIAVAKR